MKLEIKITDVSVIFMANIQKRFGDKFKVTGFSEDTQLFTAVFLEEFPQDAQEREKIVSEVVDDVLKEADHKNLDRAISDVAGFKNRAVNCLERAGIKFVRQLTELTERELSDIRNMGRSTVWNVKHVLTKMGLKLKE
ncbi:MAG: DNA-directed RNA polymerase subunit alpha [uncultured bacterium]|nr:MAG: DNA-directed RNA polymerase subunit alpha [uncultured bacterium]